MKKKSVATAIAAFLIFLPAIVYCQAKSAACADIKNGVFYSYPKNSADRYFSIREGNLQREANMANGDTIAWRVDWLDDCTYAVKYLSGGKEIPKETVSLLKKHKLVYQVDRVTPDYYTFTGHFDKASNVTFQTDTMWLHEKVNVVSNELFKPVHDPSSIRKEHFSDTSKYALLYLYRPGKLTNSLSSYLVYFNDNLMYVARNNSGYLFKIVQEGTFTLSSRLYKDESSVSLPVKFGNTYYVKSMIHWGVSSRLYNFKLEMAAVQPETGKAEFLDVNFR